MEIQRRISEENNRKKIGKTFKIIIDRIEGEHYIGRTQHDSPEVDNETLVARDSENAGVQVGSFYDVEIYDATEFDLFGKVK